MALGLNNFHVPTLTSRYTRIVVYQIWAHCAATPYDFQPKIAIVTMLGVRGYRGSLLGQVLQPVAGPCSGLTHTLSRLTARKHHVRSIFSMAVGGKDQIYRAASKI